MGIGWIGLLMRLLPAEYQSKRSIRPEVPPWSQAMVEPIDAGRAA